MAFQFVPPFEEGDKQTNDETGVEYIFTDGAWRPLGQKIENQLDDLDERYVQKAGDTVEGHLDLEGEIKFELPKGTGGVSRIRLMRCHQDEDGNGGNSFQFSSHPSSGGSLTNAKIHIDISNTQETGPKTKLRFLADPVQDDNAISLGYADESYLQLSGGTLTNSLTFNRGSKSSPQFGIEPNSSTSDTNIYVFNDGQMRLRSTHTSSIDDRVGSHIVLDPNGGEPQTKIYNVVEPTNDTMAANKLYVDTASSGKLIPPGLHFDFANSTSVVVGKMAYYEDGGLRMRLHKTSKDLTWNQSGPTADVSYAEGHMFTIYNIGNSGSWNIIRTGTINRIDWHDFDILCYVSSHQTNGTFSTNKTYYVTIAGIC